MCASSGTSVQLSSCLSQSDSAVGSNCGSVAGVVCLPVCLSLSLRNMRVCRSIAMCFYTKHARTHSHTLPLCLFTNNVQRCEQQMVPNFYFFSVWFFMFNPDFQVMLSTYIIFRMFLIESGLHSAQNWSGSFFLCSDVPLLSKLFFLMILSNCNYKMSYLFGL